MPRQVRIEYAGAFYHVMARGNRKGDIVFDDEDRKTFLRTLGEVCKRAGFRIHAYALMSNHYHLLLETPQANLTVGMGWFQNAFTRRINTRHRLWGHLFGGRYKPGEALASSGNAFSIGDVAAKKIKGTKPDWDISHFKPGEWKAVKIAELEIDPEDGFYFATNPKKVLSEYELDCYWLKEVTY